MHIYFDRPLFLLILPVALGLLIFSMKFMYTRNFRTKLGQVLLRFFLMLLLTLSLAGFSVKLSSKDVTTIFLVDASDSVREKRNEVVEFVNNACEEKGRHDKVGIICFGSDTRVEQFISKDVSFSSIQADVATNATDLEEAVKMALAQLPEDSAKRIVLITDGNENEGALKETASDVIAQGIDFQIKKIEENVANEVYVSNLAVPEQVGIGENFNIEVEIESNVAGPAKVSLYSGRSLKGQLDVNLQKGTNNFLFMDTQTDEGLKTYRVVVEAADDTVSVNNEFSAYTNCETTLPVLLVEGKPGNSINLMRVLDSVGIYYDLVSPATVPNNISDLTQYSAVIMIDTYAADLRDGFMDNIESYVKNFGGGLILTGGKNSFALGGYRGTPLETVSPVYMDLSGENEVPAMAFEMVIDHSGSMSDGNGIINNLDLAKESAVAALDNLTAKDYVGVIAFDDSYDKVVPITHPDNLDTIRQKIYSISIEGGTSIYPALEQAVMEVNSTDAMVKHIILLTDGQDYMSDYDDLKKVINDAGITVSSIAIGDGCNEELLRGIAEDCSGRYFYTDLDTDIPRIFAQEVFLSSNNYLINEEFVPIVCGSEMSIAEITADGMPTLLGYIATTPKERSIETLRSPYGDPILCSWQYGLGRSVAFTSDVTGEWSGNFSSWEGNQRLWYNIIKYATEYTGMEGAYIDVEQKGSKAKVTYVTEEYTADSKITCIVMDDDGNEQEIELDPIKPGVYETEISTGQTGVYTINVQQEEKGELVGSTTSAAIMQYSMEYRFYPNNTLLEDYASIVGASFIEVAQEVFATQPEFVKARWNFATVFMILACILLLLDIAARRFNLNLLAFVPDENRRELSRAKAQARKEAKLNKKIEKQAARANSKESSNAIKEAAPKEVVVENTNTAAPTPSQVKAQANPQKAQATKQSAASQPKEAKTPKPSVAQAAKPKAPQNVSIVDAAKARTVVFERDPASMPVSKPASAPASKPVAPAQNTQAAKPANMTGAPQSKMADKKPGSNVGSGNTGSVLDANKRTRVWTRDS